MTEKKKNIPELRFPEFEGEWVKIKIRELSTKITDGTHDTPKVTETGIPYLTAIHIKDGFIDYDNCYYLDIETHKKIFSRCNPEFNDILMVNIGAGTATTALNKVNYEFSLKNVALIKLDKTKSDSHFLVHIQRFNTHKLFNRITSGGAQPFLSLKEIGKISHYFPSLPEQQKIASFLTSVDERIQQLTKKKELLEKYKKGIMQKIFSQQIRFKDDDGNDFPDWEEKRLGEVSKFRRGSFPQPYGMPEWYSEDGLPFVQVFDVDNNMKLKKVTKQRISQKAQPNSVFAEKGSIVLTIQGSIGRIAITQYDAYIDRTLLLFTDFFIPLVKEFFMYSVFLLFEREKIKAPGGTIKTITKEELTQFSLKIPLRNEQQKIADFLSSIDKKIEAVEVQLEKTKAFKKGLLQKMFV